MEENIGIYRRYIVYREGSTRYFMEKNWRWDISVNIAKISAIYRFGEIYRRFFQKIVSGGKKSMIYRRYIGDISVRGDISEIFSKNRLRWQKIGDISLIFWWYLPSFMQCDLTAQITPVLIRRPRCDSNGNMAIQRPDCSQFFIQRLKLIFNSKLMFQRLFWPKFLL